jgi:PAS domain S-box-containing protein
MRKRKRPLGAETPAAEREPAALQRITAAWQQTTAALHDSERRYRELVEYSLGLICTHDLTGTILSINPAAAASLGYSPQDGIGRNLRGFLAPETRHLFDDYLRRIQQQGQDEGLMRVVDRSANERIWMYRNVVSQGRFGKYVLGHAIDVTARIAAERTLRAAQAELEARVKERTIALQRANERLRLEVAERERAQREAQDANRLKDEFLGTLSHELRTPLNAIYGWARILRAKKLDAATAHAIEVIERNAETQVRLIEEVLDVSRIIQGKMALQLERVDAAMVAGAAIETLQPAMHAKRIRLEARLEAVGPVLGDSHRLQQVFWNLLSNAVKFTGPDGVITVTLRRDGEFALFEINDTGVGIRRDVLPFVFDRFRQADSSSSRLHGGLGLGLAIVRHIVELHGGSVDAASPGEGHGATFSIQLPLADELVQPADEVPSPHAELPTAPARLRDRTLLVVEDHEDARELVAGVLASAGARVIAAATTPEALSQVESVRPDLLVADLGLPGEDGYVLLARLRARYPAVPAMALTAYARAADRERVLAAGFQQHVVKPVDPAQLVELVVGLLRAAEGPSGAGA